MTDGPETAYPGPSDGPFKEKSGFILLALMAASRRWEQEVAEVCRKEFALSPEAVAILAVLDVFGQFSAADVRVMLGSLFALESEYAVCLEELHNLGYLERFNDGVSDLVGETHAPTYAPTPAGKVVARKGRTAAETCAGAVMSNLDYGELRPLLNQIRRFAPDASLP